MKVATAIGNPYLNEELRKYNEYEVVSKDIQYQDGILELLNEIEDIKLLIISNNLIEEYNFGVLIEEILKLKKSMEIIVFLKSKDEEIEQFLNSKKLYKIYYLNEEGYKEFFDRIIIKKSLKNNANITTEISDLKNIILNNKLKIKEKNETKIIIMDGICRSR